MADWCCYDKFGVRFMPVECVYHHVLIFCWVKTEVDVRIWNVLPDQFSCWYCFFLVSVFLCLRIICFSGHFCAFLSGKLWFHIFWPYCSFCVFCYQVVYYLVTFYINFFPLLFCLFHELAFSCHISWCLPFHSVVLLNLIVTFLILLWCLLLFFHAYCHMCSCSWSVIVCSGLLPDYSLVLCLSSSLCLQFLLDSMLFTQILNVLNVFMKNFFFEVSSGSLLLIVSSVFVLCL